MMGMDIPAEIRQWTGDQWITVVNHGWDVGKVTAYDPLESPLRGDIRVFGVRRSVAPDDFLYPTPARVAEARGLLSRESITGEFLHPAIRANCEQVLRFNDEIKDQND